MSRTKIVQKPLRHSPKACLVTGRADGDIVDFGIDAKVGPLPHVYIKLSEVEKAAKLAGMLSASEVASLQEERTRLIAELGEVRSEIKSSRIQARAEAASFAYAGAASATSVIAKYHPDIELPDAEIIAAAKELVEPTQDETLNQEA